MKQIIDIPDELFSIFKKHGIMAFDYLNEYDKDQIAITITHGTPYNPSGDCISREALKEQVKNEVCEVCFDSPDERQCSPNCKLCTFKQLIDNAQTIPLPNEQIAWEQGYEAGLAQGKNDRPKGEWIDDSPISWKCSCCGYGVNRWNNTPFCPNCGASMKGGAKNG